MNEYINTHNYSNKVIVIRENGLYLSTESCIVYSCRNHIICSNSIIMGDENVVMGINVKICGKNNRLNNKIVDNSKCDVSYNDYIKRKETDNLLDMSCSICTTNTINIFNRPCGHACMCKQCYNDLFNIHGHDTSCPICRETLISTHDIYF